MDNKEIMTDREKVLSFGEMVEATEKLSHPWKKAFIISNIAHVIVEFFLAVLCGLMIYYAYMVPVDLDQEQHFDEQTQYQHYSESYTKGD